MCEKAAFGRPFLYAGKSGAGAENFAIVGTSDGARAVWSGSRGRNRGSDAAFCGTVAP